MKSLFIAEKPSVAKAYCELLEKIEKQIFTKKDGYYESSDYYISWCYGHLISLSEPSEYGWTEWVLNDLPMLPDQWKYNIKNDIGSKKQFKTIKELTKISSKIINGADPDREGELIVRLILNQANANHIPQFRFWNHSMTFTDLEKAWKNLKPAEDYNNLFSSASCRQRADWLIGMNLSRAYSLKSNTRGISVGRVQTPTLNMIVERDNEIENWKQSFYSLIESTWFETKLVYIGNSSSENIKEFLPAEEFQMHKIIAESSGVDFVVDTYESKNIQQHAPLFYNLADLQKDANKKHSLSADESLNAVQSLYEKSLVSYPRTDCNYITEEMYQESFNLMLKLNDSSIFQENLNDSPPKSVNTNKVTAHTALIPTKQIDGEILNNTEMLVYDLIKHQFIQAFGKAKISLQSTLIVKTSNSNHYYKTVNTSIIDKGWTVLNNVTEKNDEPKINPGIDKSTKGKFSNIETVQKERTKPNRFTEGTLLTAMENASKNINDDSIKNDIKKSGIGTPATRANIIEQLKAKNYITTDKKHLISTSKGRDLINVVSPIIKSPTLTAQWEQQLSDIENGDAKWKDFYSGIVDYTNTIVKGVISSEKITINNGTAQTMSNCPQCNTNSLKTTPNGVFCENTPSCDFKLFRKQFGKELSQKAFNDLLLKSKCAEQTFKSKAGKSYKAELIRSGLKVSLEFKK